MNGASFLKMHGTEHRPWLTALLARRPTKVAAIALANKLARMAWAMMATGARYNSRTASAMARASPAGHETAPHAIIACLFCYGPLLNLWT